MISDDAVSFLKWAGSVFGSRLFVGPALWNGAQEMLFRRKQRWLRVKLADFSRQSPGWSEEELGSAAGSLCAKFFELLNILDEEGLKNITHPDAWGELRRDVLALRGSGEVRKIFSLEVQGNRLVHAQSGLENQEREMVMRLELVGRFETWKRSGLTRSRFVKTREYWVFRTHMKQWRVFNRYGSWSWWRFVGK
jgi:hypothetical protein